MASYVTREQRDLDVQRATMILEAAAKAQGMNISTSQDVVRVKDTDGTTILSLYRPYYTSSNRFFIEGLFVPYMAGRIVGRSRYASKRSFWRSTAVKAATDALPYIRRQNTAESLEAERQRVLSSRDERPSKYAGTSGRYISGSDMNAFALAAFRSGFRCEDECINATLAQAAANEDSRLSDSLWYDLLWNSFAPAIRDAQAA